MKTSLLGAALLGSLFLNGASSVPVGYSRLREANINTLKYRNHSATMIFDSKMTVPLDKLTYDTSLWVHISTDATFNLSHIWFRHLPQRFAVNDQFCVESDQIHFDENGLSFFTPRLGWSSGYMWSDFNISVEISTKDIVNWSVLSAEMYYWTPALNLDYDLANWNYSIPALNSSKIDSSEIILRWREHDQYFTDDDKNHRLVAWFHFIAESVFTVLGHITLHYDRLTVFSNMTETRVSHSETIHKFNTSGGFDYAFYTFFDDLDMTVNRSQIFVDRLVIPVSWANGYPAKLRLAEFSAGNLITDAPTESPVAAEMF